MGRQQTMVQLTDELVALLDAEAARRGVSRSALIREALAAFLAESAEAEITRRIVEGYTRFPPTTPDEWGDLDRFGDAAAGEIGRRLDQEEREAGQPSW